jgi:hypothetical protein
MIFCYIRCFNCKYKNNILLCKKIFAVFIFFETLFYLKGNISISAGNCPADYMLKRMFEKQNFKLKTTNMFCHFGQWCGMCLFPQAAACALPAVMKILPVWAKTAKKIILQKKLRIKKIF